MTLKEKVQATRRNSIKCSLTEVKRKTGKKLYTKVGGNPDLPKDFEWYYNCKEYGGHPLSFVAQFDLSELKDYDADQMLPESGMLYFFYDFEADAIGCYPEDRESARVFYYDGAKENLVETEPPENLKEDYRIPEFRIKFSKHKDIPAYEELKEQLDEEMTYEDYAFWASILRGRIRQENIVKLLGYADLIQTEIISMCELVQHGIDCSGFEYLSEKEKYHDESKEWILLFQLDVLETDDFALIIGDTGRLYYYIKKQDLKEKRFDKAWFATQCY